MPYFFAVTLMLALAAFLLGMINPSIVVHWGAKRGRDSVWIVYGTATVLSFIMIAVTAPDTHKATSPRGEVSTAQPATTITQPQPEPKNESQTITLPSTEVEFAKALFEYTDDYEAAPNELKKSAVRSERKQAIRQALKGNTSVSGWIGRIYEMGTTGEGEAYISIKLGDSDLQIKTWNNSFSDISDHTLIKHGTSLYNALSELDKGTLVEFSGRFLKDSRDFVKEGSLTEEGSMTDPEFLFRFSEVKAL